MHTLPAAERRRTSAAVRAPDDSESEFRSLGKMRPLRGVLLRSSGKSFRPPEKAFRMQCKTVLPWWSAYRRTGKTFDCSYSKLPFQRICLEIIFFQEPDDKQRDREPYQIDAKLFQASLDEGLLFWRLCFRLRLCFGGSLFYCVFPVFKILFKFHNCSLFLNTTASNNGKPFGQIH